MWLAFNIVVPVGLLALGAYAIVLMGKVEPESRPEADTSRDGRLKALPAVRVVEVKRLNLDEQPLILNVDGVVVPFREAQIAAEVAGRITFKSTECEAGAVVKKGDLLMKIDRTNYDLEVSRITKQKEQAYQSIVELDQELANTRKLIDVAKKDMTIQQAEVDRQLALPRGFSSPRDIDQAKRGLLQAEQTKVNLDNQIKLLTSRRTRLEAAEQLAATQLEVAEVDAKRTEIRAPMSGVIVSEQAEENTFVNRGSPLMVIEDTTKVEVLANLRMDQLYWVLDQVKEQDPSEPVNKNVGYQLPEVPATVEFDLTGRQGTVYRWSGKLAGYNGIGLDANTRTVPVRIVVDNPQEYVDQNGEPHHTQGPTALVRGMYVRIKLNIKPKTPLVVIPALAMKPGNRIWQFVPDDSVLDPPETGEKESEMKTDASVESNNEIKPTRFAASKEPEPTMANKDGADDAKDKQKDTSSELEDGFEPTQWQAGMVMIRDSVVPVDALQVANSVDETSTFDPDKVVRKIWVCEIRDRSIVEGSFVVTSPLASVNQKGAPARAKTMAVGMSPPTVEQNSVAASAAENKEAVK